ncbi:MAG TPA: hypothetical protein VHG69_01595 [Thermoleophilaceae bacterium]|nr:hypothetical protein [Thermoleophilaceae bacterium]
MVLLRSVAACALAATACLLLAACGKPSEEAGIEEPAREGLAIPIGRAYYNVFQTRQLNLETVPDRDYYLGETPPRDETLYGVFIQVCNEGEEPVETAEHFVVTDNQGTEFEPVELPEDNVFAYQPQRLDPDQCIPQVGSVAQQGPTGASMLLFRLPLDATENRPLELEVQAPFDPSTGKRETRKFELDI